MSAEVKNEKWTEKPAIQSSVFLGGIGILVIFLAYLKLRPYWNAEPVVQTYNGDSQSAEEHTPAEATKKKEGETHWLNSLLPGVRSPHGGSGSRVGIDQARTPVRVIERPLFDGLTVSVRATLTRGISSLEPDSSVEAVFEELVRSEETAQLDDQGIRGAKLLGVATPNLDLKRMGLHFSELVTREGRSYRIQATAIDPESKTQGVPAQYSSGLPSRLAGVGLSRVITAADQILMNKVLPDPAGGSVTQQASVQVARQFNDQAANDISLEATRELREAKAELSLPSGTPLMLRLRVTLDQRLGGDG